MKGFCIDCGAEHEWEHGRKLRCNACRRLRTYGGGSKHRRRREELAPAEQGRPATCMKCGEPIVRVEPAPGGTAVEICKAGHRFQIGMRPAA